MCVILVCPPKVRPDRETLSLCATANPHGAGIAWRADNRVRWFKTNDVDEVFRLASALRGEIVIHFRIASVGRICDELRHPFPISRRAGLVSSGSWNAVLFQNGTWHGWRAALAVVAEQGFRIPKGEMNDTRAAAFLCSIYGQKFLNQCTPSRWVFFEAKETAIFSEWFKREGILFSNLYWDQRRRAPFAVIPSAE